MRIKFNRIQDLNDARYASAALSEWVGFAINELPIGKVQDIIGWCAGPKLTLELNHTELLETAISWCTVLPANALECPISQFDFWYGNIPNSDKYEWILSDNNADSFLNFSTTAELSFVFHLITNSLTKAEQELNTWNSQQSTTENLLINASEWLNQPREIKNLNASGLSIDCTPEIILGEKNYDTITELFEQIDIF